MTYTEVVVSRKNPPGLKAKRNLAFAAALVSLAGTMLTWFCLPLTVVLGVLALRLTEKLDIEYQYYQLGNDFDIAKITGGRKRKEIATLDLSQVMLIAPADSDRAADYADWVTADFSARDPEHAPWAVICTHRGNRRRVLIQMNEPLLRALKRQLPGKVFEQ